mmetsp:Transcript_5248/g.15260  ORF Transcript_5248/g.15260 Transcript_5248/m.15260 type:complete len:148 (-) Transcript_5248:422-865(-)
MVGNDTKGRRRRPAKGAASKKNDAERTVAKRGRGGKPGKAKHEIRAKNNKQANKGQQSGGIKKGNVGRRNSKGGAKGKKREKKEPMTAEQLDASMDDYWAKSKDKTVVSKKLDDDMDDYWAKKGEENTEEEAGGEKAETKEDEKQEE